jgi:two-component system alkaline phosphatase synthesis response regulator PhoP
MVLLQGYDDLSTSSTVGYSYNESEKISCSFDGRYYDEIITRLRLQPIQEYEYSQPQQYKQQQQQQQEKLQQEKKLHNQKRKHKILLVDDEPDLCMVYQMVLEDAGYECKSYTDPVKALQEFRPNYYGLVILDIKMPLLNGFELCKNIIELDKTVQVIFLTAGGEYHEEIRRQSHPELADNSNIDYVQKPIGNQELVQIVNMIIANSITMD